MTLTALLLASIPFIYFMSISAITPGPNNLMLAASGMNFGIRRSVPHIAGVTFGFMTLMLMCLFGVGAMYHTLPQLRVGLNVFCIAYIAYLSWKIATAGRPEALDPDGASKPFAFWQAALFQFVNPKGWVAALASTSTLLPDTTLAQQIVVVLLVAFLTGLPSLFVWTAFGKSMAKIFTSEKSHHIINIILALALVATIPMMIVH